MPIPIPSPLVEFILLGPLDDRRQIQDSPILGDVWVEYGKQPNARLDLLIVPYRAEHPGAVAAIIDDALASNLDDVDEKEMLTWNDIANQKKSVDVSDDNPKVAYLQGLVVAR